jgi:hypothetical protein
MDARPCRRYFNLTVNASNKILQFFLDSRRCGEPLRISQNFPACQSLEFETTLKAISRSIGKSHTIPDYAE